MKITQNLLLLSHLPLRLVMGEAQVEASPGVDGQDKARMIGIPLLLQVVAINLVGSKWWDVQDSRKGAVLCGPPAGSMGRWRMGRG